MFPLERSINIKPEHIKDRTIFSDWERDLMIFRREYGKAYVASLIKRKTRFAIRFQNNNRNSKHFIKRLMNVMESIPQTARQSISFDRGTEFSGWHKLETVIGS